MALRSIFSLLLLWVSGCSSALYFPTSERYFEPEQFELQAERVEITPEPGRKIYGDYYSPSKPTPLKGVFVFFHGNGENRTSHFATLHWMPPIGFNYLIFDYAGYADSEGRPTPEVTVRDGMAAIRWAAARAKHSKVPLFVFAQSLGGAVALRSIAELKGEVPIRLIVIDSSFLSYRDAARGVLAHQWWTWWLQPLVYFAISDAWAPLEHIEAIAPIPLVVMHGERDRVIDYELGRELFMRAPEPKEFWHVPGGRHTDGLWGHRGEFRKRLIARISEIVNSKKE